MKVKSENTKLIIWAVVALVIGVVIGMLITNATTGNAKYTLKSSPENWTLGQNETILLKSNMELKTKGGQFIATVNGNKEVQFNEKIGKLTKNPTGGATYEFYDDASGEVIFDIECYCSSYDIIPDLTPSCNEQYGSGGHNFYCYPGPGSCCSTCQTVINVHTGHVIVVSTTVVD